MTKYSKITKIEDSILNKIGVYKLESPSGKIYIGSTINSFRNRFNHHFNDYSNNPIKKALKKYKRENFSYTILEILNGKSQEYIRKRETYYIKMYNSTNKKIGYNLLESAEICFPKNQKAVMQFDLNNNFLNKFKSIKQACDTVGTRSLGIIISCRYKEGERQRLTNKKYKWLYEKDYNNGKRPSIVTKSKRRNGRKSIIQKDLNNNIIKIWRCSADINDALNYDISNIHNCCKNKLKTYKKYKWSYE